MKNKIINICIVVLLSIIGLFIYINTNKEEQKTKEHYFKETKIENLKTIKETSINYKEKYSDYIINEELLSVDYNFLHEDESITGTIYIGEDKGLYITDANINKIHKISNEKFKTMYISDYFYKDKLFVFLISEKNKVYNVLLYGNDISQTRLYKYSLNDEFTNFVDIEFEHDIYDLAIPIFALTKDDKIIDINSGLKYDESVVALYNNIYVYDDKTMTDVYGKIIEDEDGKAYKIKYIFNVYDSNGFIKDENQFIIVTEDYRLIYCNLEMTKVYEFDKKVKDIKYDKYYPYIDGKLEIIFEDDYKVDFTARCNQYFCINEFVE